jgi:hypothetical protein
VTTCGLAHGWTESTELCSRQQWVDAPVSKSASFTYFSPVLDWHVWSGLVIKLKLKTCLIPPMSPEDEIWWRGRGSENGEEQHEEEQHSTGKLHIPD